MIHTELVNEGLALAHYHALTQFGPEIAPAVITSVVEPAFLPFLMILSLINTEHPGILLS